MEIAIIVLCVSCAGLPIPLLRLAAVQGSVSVVRLLIKAGIPINAQDDDGRTVAMHVARCGPGVAFSLSPSLSLCLVPGQRLYS